eukprot:scaffold446_cov183-Ochromonas_danica.AAC.11
MPETPPKGIHPLFLRGATLEKFGLKTGEGVHDVVTYKYVPKEDIMKEIQVMGVMSDFEPAKKLIEPFTGDQILIYVDPTQKYGETYLLCYTPEARDGILNTLLEQEEAIKAQLMEEMKAEEERRRAEEARLNVVYEDKPMTPRPYLSVATHESEADHKPRDPISIEISRPKRFVKNSYKFGDRNAQHSDNAATATVVAEFRAYKDPNFKSIRETENGIQVAPMLTEAHAQTTWYRSVNKAVQYESTCVGGTDNIETSDPLLVFLEKATVRVEQALQQNESVDIFNDTFRLLGEEEGTEGVQVENELRELKNFADANYSKSKALVAIDWMPKAQGMVAVTAVRNISFDQRIPILGQTHASFIMLWDFRLLVKPLVLMQSHHEVFTFRFNRTNPSYVAGGCITGQVLLWEVNEAVNAALRRNNRGSTTNASNTDEDDELSSAPLIPKYVSAVDYSHKKCVADMFWLPPTTQINYRGQLVGEEHLDGQSHQFITVAADGLIMVWDTRFEKIYNDELRHIGRPKHVPTEKSSNKEGGHVKPLWAPIFKAHLKRMEGVGELSLCRVSETADPRTSNMLVGKPASFAGDSRSQFIMATEEGDLVFADLSARKTTNTTTNKEEEEEEDTEFSCVKWITVDHARPAVYMQESPFFPQIVLTISDWNFHICKLGEEKPLFVSPLSNVYLTAGAWSTTRPAVLFVACADGQILVWDFTDSGFRPSIELKATHSKITSMELLASQGQSRFQMLAVGDEAGTLHIFEMPRNLTKPVHKEETIMLKFLERELQRIELDKAEGNAESLIGAERLKDVAEKAAGSDESPLPVPAVVAPPPPLSPPKTSTTASGFRTGSAPGTAGSSNQEGGGEASQPVSKEEEDFLKLESIFISELGLDGEHLPAFARQ